MTKQNDTTPPPGMAVARLAPSRLPIVKGVAEEFDVTADQWRVLVDQIFPNARSVEAIGMALSYCRARKLDIYKRPVHIVPMWSSALGKMVETVWPGIAEIRTTAHRTGNYAGIDPVKWGPITKRSFFTTVENEDRSTRQIETVVEYPEYAEVTVYRMVEGQRMAFTAQVFWDEAYATAGRDTLMPNAMWMKRPRGQLDKCGEAAALRKAFPEELGNTYAAEEMEGRTIDSAPVAIEAKPATPALPEYDEPPPPTGGPAAPALHKPDLPEGAKSEAGAASAGETDKSTNASNSGNSQTPADQAGDFNDDGSGVSTERTPDELLADLEHWLGQAKTEDDIEETWSSLDIESEFSRDPERMGKAIDMKTKHIQRLEQKIGGEVISRDRTEAEEQATLDLIDKNFPGARGT